MKTFKNATVKKPQAKARTGHGLTLIVAERLVFLFVPRLERGAVEEGLAIVEPREFRGERAQDPFRCTRRLAGARFA